MSFECFWSGASLALPQGVLRLSQSILFKRFGRQAALDGKTYDIAMDTARCVRGSGSLAWVDLMQLGQASVPINLNGIQRLTDEWVEASPDAFAAQLALEVAVPHDAVKWTSIKPLLRGKLRLVSPEEPVHAFVLAVKDLIDSGADNSVLMHLAKNLLFAVHFQC